MKIPEAIVLSVVLANTPQYLFVRISRDVFIDSLARSEAMGSLIERLVQRLQAGVVTDRELAEAYSLLIAITRADGDLGHIEDQVNIGLLPWGRELLDMGRKTGGRTSIVHLQIPRIHSSLDNSQSTDTSARLIIP